MTDQIITEYDFDKTRLLVRNEDTDDYEWVHADVIIAADGIKSRCRAAMYKRQGAIDEGMSSWVLTWTVRSRLNRQDYAD